MKYLNSHSALKRINSPSEKYLLILGIFLISFVLYFVFSIPFANAATLNIVKSGNGTGIVEGTVGSLLDCEEDCVFSDIEGSSVTLTAIPDSGSTFAGWSGASGCTTNSICTFTISGDIVVTAQFNLGGAAGGVLCGNGVPDTGETCRTCPLDLGADCERVSADSEDSDDTIGGFGNPLKNPKLSRFLHDSLKSLVSILTPIVAIIYIITGLLFVSARGDPVRLSLAKKFFLYNTLAAVIVLGAWVFIQTLGNTLTSVIGT